MGVYWELDQEYVAWGGSVLDGDDILINNASHVDIYAGYGNDSISNEGGEVKIFGENGNDTIVHWGDDNVTNVTIDGGLGDDYISVGHGYNLSISGGFAGNDTIKNFVHDSTIFGGDTGNKVIASYGHNNTIIGSRGNDYIINFHHSNIWGGYGSEGNDTLMGDSYNQEIFWFGHDDGNDVFLNAGSDDVIFLYDMNVSHYGYGSQDSDNFTIVFRGGSKITVQCNDQFTPVFQFGSGERFTCDRSTGYWHSA